MASAGDFDGDGYDDVVVGARGAGASGAGAAYVFLGGPGATFDDTADATLTGTGESGGQFGFSVASAGSAVPSTSAWGIATRRRPLRRIRGR